MKTKFFTLIITLMTLFSTMGITHQTTQGETNTQASLPSGFNLIERGQTWNKYYNTTTGEYALEIFCDEVNYQDANQTWSPIDTRIVEVEKIIDGRQFSHGMSKSRYQVFFTEDSNTDTDRLMSLLNGSHIFSFTPLDSLDFSDGIHINNKQPTTGFVEDNSINYPCLYGEGIHLMFSCLGYGVKSMYVIDNKSIFPTPDNENCTVDFKEMIALNNTHTELENHSLGIVYGSDNSEFKEYGTWENREITTPDCISFRDEQNATVFSIPWLYAWDSSSGDSCVLLNKTLHMTFSGNLWIEIHVPYTWLSNASRVYPLYVDPTVTIYSSTADGYLDKSNGNYTTAWASLTGTIKDTYNYLKVGQRLGSPPLSLYTLYRGFLFFNTSSIHDNVSINSVIVSLYGKSKQITSQNFNLTIQNGQPDSPHAPLQSNDYYYGNYSGNGGSMNTSGFITTGYNNITMNSVGRSWVNLTGTTKLCLRSSRDMNQTAPTTQNPNEYVEIYTSEKGVGYKPKCIITYELRLSIVVNFAGNLSDKGGPFWRSPGETVKLAGAWSDGYYTNDSRQQEDWMYINLTVIRPTGSSNQYTALNVSHVWLQWLNGTTWTNWTYAFSQTGAYWEYNTSGSISTHEGYDYSFDIVANDTSGNSFCVGWNKTGIGGRTVRRFVQLGCDQIDISYTPFYLFNFTSETGNPPTYMEDDEGKRDRLHHDQGPDGTLGDSGYLSYYAQELNDTMHLCYCSALQGIFLKIRNVLNHLS